MPAPRTDPNSDLEGAAPGFAEVNLGDLRVGALLQTPLFDPRSDRDILLLAAGKVITPKQLANIRKRGLTRVRVNSSEVENLTGRGGSRRSKTEPRLKQRTVPAAVPFAQKIRKRGASSHDVKSVGKTEENYRQSVAQAKNLYRALASRGEVDGKSVVAAADESLMQMAEDIDLFVSLGISSPAGNDVSEHGLQVSRLAMAIGASMGLEQKSLVELGVGCLIHDVGMLGIKSGVHAEPRILSELEFLEITKHPGYTLDMVEHIEDISSVSRMVAYQIHERWDGSGYPRHREGERIHPLARIAAVADAFIAMISPRPHRPALLPYDAMQQLLVDTERGLFDHRVVRQLLNTVSLFPVGSYVQMSDGRVGEVIAANGTQFTRPVVELRQPWKLHEDAQTVDLSKLSESKLRIARPIAGLTVACTRDAGANASFDAAELCPL